MLRWANTHWPYFTLNGPCLWVSELDNRCVSFSEIETEFLHLLRIGRQKMFRNNFMSMIFLDFEEDVKG